MSSGNRRAQCCFSLMVRCSQRKDAQSDFASRGATNRKAASRDLSEIRSGALRHIKCEPLDDRDVAKRASLSTLFNDAPCKLRDEVVALLNSSREELDRLNGAWHRS